jgi:hypothetical protein
MNHPVLPPDAAVGHVVRNEDRQLAKYLRFRSVIEHEDHLVNHRLSWLLIAQSFLLGACVAAESTPEVIRTIGVLTCGVTFVSVLAAEVAIVKLARKFTGGVPDGCPPLVSQWVVHGFGLIGPCTLPLLFAYAWFRIPPVITPDWLP